MHIYILGWGSLIWDKRPEFDDYHGPWQSDGPTLKLEFSRISQKTRLGALTLAIDPSNGVSCRVAYTRSTRKDPNDAICDLRSREGTVLNRVGVMFLDGSRSHGGDDTTREAIRTWALQKKLDVVIWTDLAADFEEKTRTRFTVDAACTYLQGLSVEGKVKAVEYILRAPDFIETPLRQRLQQEPWFQTPK